MYGSSFSYNITRRYPFRWFTPVAAVGGVLALVLFSVFNLALNGYEAHTVYTNDPNATLHSSDWFLKPPWSWGGRVRPTCEAQNIPIGSQVLTSVQQTYTLTSVSSYDSALDKTTKYMSLPYLNHTLGDCRIEEIDVMLKKVDQSHSGQGGWWSWDDSSIDVTAHCSVPTDEGFLNATLIGSYNTGWFNQPLEQNTTASRWWGQKIAGLYWRGLLYAASQMPIDDNSISSAFWTKGAIIFKPNQTSNVQANDFFGIGYYFVASNGYMAYYNPLTDTPAAKIYNNGSQTPRDLAFSETITESMFLAKLLYSLVLVDLGQSSLSNLLLDENNLQWILQHRDDSFRNDPNNTLSCEDVACYFVYQDVTMLAAPNATNTQPTSMTPMQDAYDAFKDQLGPLGTKNATFFSQYSCSVPQRKAAGTLIVTIVIADLVFLQACWTILKWMADWLVQRHDSTAMFCQGCIEDLAASHCHSQTCLTSDLDDMS